MTATPTTARLEARISTELRSQLQHAAELEGRTMTDFVVSAIRSAAQQTIERAAVIRLSRADQERFAQALLAPPKHAPALKRAYTRRAKLLQSDD